MRNSDVIVLFKNGTKKIFKNVKSFGFKRINGTTEYTIPIPSVMSPSGSKISSVGCAKVYGWEIDRIEFA